MARPTPRFVSCAKFQHQLDVPDRTSFPDILDYAIPGTIERTNSSYDTTHYRADIKTIASWLGYYKPEIINAKIRFSRGANDLRVYVNIDCHSVYVNHWFYYPLDHRMTAEDYENVDFAELNEDGTAWVFKRSTPGAYRDLELELLGMVHTACYPYLLQAEADHAAGTPGATTKYEILAEFYGDARDNARDIHRNRHIGWYEHKPYEGRKHRTVLSAINATIFKWKSEKKSAAKLELIRANVGYLLNDLNIPDGKFAWEVTTDDDEE